METEGKMTTGGAGEMIPDEQIGVHKRRLRRMGWSAAACMLAFLLAMVALVIWMLALGGPPIPRGWNRDFLKLAFLLPLFLVAVPQFIWISITAPRCPVCGKKFDDGRTFWRMARTGRCTRCHTRIAVPIVAIEPRNDSRERKGMIRSVVYAVVGLGVGGPILVHWLAAKQLIPAVPGPWTMTFLLWLVCGALMGQMGIAVWMEHRKNKRKAEDAVLVQLTPPHPSLTVIQKSGGATAGAGRVFQMFLTPGALRFGRLTDKLYLCTPLARQMEERGDMLALRWQAREQLEKRRREAMYLSIDPTSPDFLVLDPVNFAISRDVITDLLYEAVYKWPLRERRRGTVGSGILHIAKGDQRVQNFIVVDELSKPEVDEMLSAWLQRSSEAAPEVTPPAL
jgi:hypothetical protein